MQSLVVLAIVLTALSMSFGMAHALEMRVKLRLSAAKYLETQRLYQGWALAGLPLMGAFVTTVLLAFGLRGTGMPFGLVVGGAVAIGASIVVFFTRTFPINRATQNWTTLPGNWESLRRRWEYSHAIGAACLLIALTFLASGAVASPGW